MIFRIDLKIIALIIILYFTNQIRLYSIIMVFAILHELSHLFMGMVLKMKVRAFTIMPFGLYIEFKSPIKDNNYIKQEISNILIALAGPVFNLMMIYITHYLKINPELKKIIVNSNLSLFLFNLLPIFPLDGGRIVKSALRIFLNKKLAIIYTNRICKITLFILTFLFSILVYYYKNLMLLFIIIYLWYIVLKQIPLGTGSFLGF